MGVDAAVTVSADGKLLYVALGSSVLVVDSDSLTTVDEIFYPHTRPVAVSSDNKLLAIFGSELYILNTSDYSLVFSDTGEYEYKSGVFSSDSKAFYCASTPNTSTDYGVLRVDMSDSLYPITKRNFSSGTVTQVIPSLDESKWFLYLAVGLSTYSFEVYDNGLDTIVFTDVLIPGAGYTDNTSDGKYVFYTNPGRTGTDPPTDYSIKIYNVSTNEIEAVIADTSYFVFGQVPGPPKRLAVTPDNRWLGILGGQMFLTNFYLYDICNEKLVYRKGPDTILFKLNDYRSMSIQNMK